MKSKIADAKEKLVGEKYSLMSVVTSIEPESEESVRFFSKLRKALETGNSGKSYLVGNAAMSDEMRSTFSSDNNTVMFLTVISIFLVVLFTFRSLAVPIILVMLVQCGVFAAVCAIGLMGGDIHYLALLIVQCILMGATIDYGILFAEIGRAHV